MRIPDDLLDCVCFLCVQKPTKSGGSEWKYGGTGFFVTVQNEVDSRYFHSYLVTARHCLEKPQKLGLPLYLRMNTVNGSAKPVLVNRPWVFSADRAADVAVLPWAPSLET